MLSRCLLLWCLLISTGSLRSDDFADLFRQAAADTAHGDYQGAIAKYQAALAIRSGAPEALNNLAVVFYQAQRFTEAYNTASPIWQNHRELKSAALIAGLAAVQCNRPQDAVAPLESLLASDAENRDALLGLASARYALQQLPEAAAIYERRIASALGDAQAWYGLAICYERLAENGSRKLSQMAGGAGYSKQLVAEYLQSAGGDKLAAEAFGEATALATSSPDAERQYQAARTYAGKSRNAFEQFVALAPDSWQAAVFLGDVDRQHNDLASALTHYKKAAEEQPGNPAPLLGLGTVYWQMGDFERAADYLRQTLRLNPKADQASFELANIAVRQHREADAIPLLEHYLAAQPDALAARADLGRAFLHIGQYEKAVVELKRATTSDERGDVHYQLSLALRKLGRAAESDEALKQSSALREAQATREQRLHADH